VAAAAGGPKGLALIPLDRWLFGSWLRDATRRRALFGASIGAWRMAAAAQTDPVTALDRLEHAYLERQRYPEKPTAAHVSRVCREIARELIGDDAAGFTRTLEPSWALQVVTARQRGPRARARLRFALAAAANAIGRDQLAAHLQRVVFSVHAAGPSPAVPPDRFATRHVALDAANLEDALLASGSIPLLAEPVRSIAGAPPGDYWDGGLIDYHLYWNYAALDGIVVYPHFVPHVTAGWLDKFLPWRRHGVGAQGRRWLDNVLMVVPSPGLLARLPNGKLPDRNDFHRYGTDHDRRLRDWRRAIAECARMADEFAAFVERPQRLPIDAL
jgi:hypothetical protein